MSSKSLASGKRLAPEPDAGASASDTDLMALIGNAGVLDLLGLSSGSSSSGKSSSGATSTGAGSGGPIEGSSGPGAPGDSSGGGVVDWLIGENGGEAWGDIWDCITGDQQWADGPTGGFMPQSLADGMEDVRSRVPADAHENGMHAWHAGTNAMLAEKLGVVGAPLIIAGGLYHETPLDWESWWAEEEWQGTVNHAIDSGMDIVANAVGLGYGYFDTSGNAVQNAIDTGNHIPGPGDPDPAFGGGGGYDGHPSKAW